jgi:hypothetical protein
VSERCSKQEFPGLRPVVVCPDLAALRFEGSHIDQDRPWFSRGELHTDGDVLPGIFHRIFHPWERYDPQDELLLGCCRARLPR